MGMAAINNIIELIIYSNVSKDFIKFLTNQLCYIRIDELSSTLGSQPLLVSTLSYSIYMQDTLKQEAAI